MEELTIQQALEQGYEYCGLYGIGYQSLTYITDLDQEDVDTDDYRLFSKETISPSVDKDSVIDSIATEAYDSLDFEVDGGDFHEHIRVAVDWDSIISKINDELGGYTFHTLTDIKLI